MPRFTDIAKVAVAVEIAQGGPIAPAQTASAPFGVAPPPGSGGAGMGMSATSQGGAPSALTAGTGAGTPPPSGPLIRSDQAQPQPRMQTTQSLPETKSPGAPSAFAPVKSKAPAAPKLPTVATAATPSAAPKPAKVSVFKLSTVLAPPSAGLLSHITEGLGMHPQMFSGGMTGKAMGAMDAYGRASTLFGIPGMVADGASWVSDRVRGTPAVDTLEARKAAAFGVPSEPLPPGAMPTSPMSSFMDVVRPLRHPIDSVKNFVSGLGAEADRQLTQSMIERPVEVHQLMYQNHPKITN